MKKIIILFFASFLYFNLSDSVFASEDDDGMYIDMSNAEITYQDDEITVWSFGNDPEIIKQIEDSPTSISSEEVIESGQIIPFLTATGPGGKVTLDPGSNGRYIYWSVKPSTAWPWTFAGEIQLRYYSGFKRDAPIWGSGGLGLSTGGLISMNKNNGGKATLKGTAYATNGNKYKVVPNATVGF